MGDIFTPDEVLKLITGKKVVFLGDSNTRGLYKDLIWLSDNCSYIPQKRLKTKLEPSYYGDRLLEGERAARGRDFREVRKYLSRDGQSNICFVFITRVYSSYMENVLDSLRQSPPDLIIINSCLWDISRWGPRGVDDYKVNLRRFLQHVQRNFRQSMLIWLTSMPISSELRGGFLIKQVEFLRHTLRFDVMEANKYCADTVRSFGYDVLDVHYFFRCLIHHRTRDGVHWGPRAVRAVTNMLLTHVSVSWNRALPERGCQRLMRQTLAEARVPSPEIQAMSKRPLSEQELEEARQLHGKQDPVIHTRR